MTKTYVLKIHLMFNFIRFISCYILSLPASCGNCMNNIEISVIAIIVSNHLHNYVTFPYSMHRIHTTHHIPVVLVFVLCSFLIKLKCLFYPMHFFAFYIWFNLIESWKLNNFLLTIRFFLYINYIISLFVFIFDTIDDAPLKTFWMKCLNV